MSTPIKIAIDAMGGDAGLQTTLPAAVQSINKHPNLAITLVGDENAIQQALAKYTKKDYDANRLAIHHASQVVDMGEMPSQALRNKKDSSMRVSINLVKRDQVAACVSAGNTGALMATAKFVLKTIPMIDRPAIVYPIPSRDPKTGQIQQVYMLDLGANVDSSSDHLFQFGIMGAVLAQCLGNIDNPRVGLLNIGEEDVKGLDSIKQASKLFLHEDIVNYIGFVEGNDIFQGKADVIVCDGFSGNIALKTMEGTAKMVGNLIKDTFSSSFFAKFFKLLSAPMLLRLKNSLDMSQYNGASFLGLTGNVVKSHGSADVNSFATAIEVAMHQAQHDVPTKIQQQITSLMHQEDENLYDDPDETGIIKKY